MRRFWDDGVWSREVPGPGYHRSVFTAKEFGHAQPYCNFVVLEPRWLPEGCAMGPISVRTEGDRWATVHFRVIGRDRRLRIKQFHHDWKELTDPATNLQGPGRPFTSQGTVGWHGTDYKGLAAACWSRLRTTVEISVEEGRFAPQEIESLCGGMAAADPVAAEMINGTPFARISFTVRRRRGPWNNDRIAGCTWSADLNQAVTQAAMPVPVPQYMPRGFTLDSVGWRRSRKGVGGEIQLLIRHLGNGTDMVCLRGTQPGSTDLVSVPPGPELRRAYQWSQLDHRLGTVWFGTMLAQVDGRPQPSPVGGWAAVWQEAGVNWECLGRSSQELTADGTRQFVLNLRMEER